VATTSVSTTTTVPTTTRKTFCGICEASCGLVATIEHRPTGRVVTNLGPDPEHPSSQGFLCVKGANFHQVAADPDRVTRPLRRLADGTFAPATWDEAFADIGRRLRTIRDEHGTEALGVAFGNPIAWNFSATVTLNAFVTELGTQHHYSSASLDINNYWAAADLLYGNTLTTPLPDFAATDFALILGTNPVVSHGSLVTTGRIRDVLVDVVARGGRVVVVDPRRTETARLFEHVPVRPGADVWLLGAMLRVILEEGLTDAAAVAAQASGLAGLRTLADRFDLVRAAEETGVPAAEIAALARDLAGARSAVVYGRCGTSLGRFSTLAKFLTDALAIVTGNLDRRGGMVFGEPMVDLESAAAKGGRFTRGAWRTRVHDVPEMNGTAPLACLPDEITTPGRGQLRGLIGMSTNIVTSAPGSEATAAALEELDLMVWLDPYLTETSRHAHWILPPTLWLEREQLPIFTQSQSTVPNAQWVPALADAPGDARDDWWIIDRIARELGVVPTGLPAAALLARFGIRPRPSTLIDLALRAGKYGDLFGLRRTGLSRKKLLATDGAIKLADACPTGQLARRVHHDDGLVHLDSAEMRDEADRLVADEPDPAFALRLFSVRELRSHNTWLHNVDRLMSGDRSCHALVHPDDAAAHGIADRAEITVASPWGTVTVPARLTDEVVAGSVGLTHGWGHRGGWRRAVEAGGANYNLLAPHDPAEIDRPSGNAFFNGIPVRIGAVRP
jgi:formate dehydrogenase